MALPQYFKIYRDRLAILKPEFKSLNAKRYTEIGTQSCIIVGVLFMVSDLKPSIFDELKYSGKKGGTYYSKDAKWFLEDESDKIELLNVPGSVLLSSGMVVGVSGRQGKKGCFEVEKIHFPPDVAQCDRPAKRVKIDEGRILLVSSVRFDENRVRFKEHLNYTMAHYKVRAIVLIGDIFTSRTCGGVKELERLLKKFKVQVITVPGQCDPTSSLHPQEPIHKRIMDFHNLENPDFIDIDGHTFLLTSGSSIEDLLKYQSNKLHDVQADQSEYRMHLAKDVHKQVSHTTKAYFKAMETILKCRITCPSAPDTLHALPETENGFVIQKSVDFFISGSGPAFGVKKVGRVYMVCLPRYGETGQFVLFDTDTCENEIIQLN